MRDALQLLFVAIMLTVIGVNVWAGQQLAVWDSWPGFAEHPWSLATLVDAYAGFLTFFVWVAYREATWGWRAAWFLLIMGLGNITMALYVIIAITRLDRDVPVWHVLLAPRHRRLVSGAAHE